MKILRLLLISVLAFAGLSGASNSNSIDNDPLLAQLDLESLKAAAAQLPQLIGNGVATEHADNGDHILAEIEKEITEAILNAVSDDEDLTSVEEMDRLIASLENEKSLEELAAKSGGRNKRLTVEFMGMQVTFFKPIKRIFSSHVENHIHYCSKELLKILFMVVPRSYLITQHF